jgi:hypothetical protein
LNTHFKGAALPETFGRFVDKEVADLARKYNLPNATQAYLLKVKPIFGTIRGVRDSIFHHGKSLERIFITEAGPGICIDSPPFDIFKHQLEANNDFVGQMQPNRIGSLFYLVVKLVDQMIEATDDLAKVLREVFPLPDRYTKEQYLYVSRGPSFLLLNQRRELLKQCWLAPAVRSVAPHLDARTHPLGRKTASDNVSQNTMLVLAKNSAAASGKDSEVDRERWIAENAYLRWINEQRGGDRSQQHWQDAEREYRCGTDEF